MIKKLLAKFYKEAATGKANRGFTILETLVAISIILMAITGPIDIIASALKASYYSRDEITAFYLAEEAIEYARNQRDNNAIDPDKTITDWLTDVTESGSVDCINDANISEENKVKCSLVQDSSGVYSYESCGTSCTTPGSGYNLKKFDTGVFGASQGSSNITETNFTREVYFTRVPDIGDPAGTTNNREVLMTVRIYWTNTFGSDNKFVLSERLFNWKLPE